MPPRRPFLPLSFADTIFPLQELGITATGTILDQIGIDRILVEADEGIGTLTFRLRLLFAHEVTIAPPGTSDLALVLGPAEGLSAIPLELTVGSSFSAGIRDLSSAVRFSHAVLARAIPGDGEDSPQWVRDLDTLYQVELPTLSLTIDGSGDVRFEGSPVISLPPAFIADTGMVVAAEGLSLHLDGSASPPPGRSAGFRGLFIDRTQLYLPEGFALGELTLTLDDAGVGDTGVFGRVSLSWTNTLSEEEPHVSGPATGDVFGIPFALKEVSLTLDQNVPAGGSLRGELLLPFFQKAVAVAIGIDARGELALRVSGAPGAESDASLIEVVLENLLRLEIDSVELRRTPEEVVQLSTRGRLQPLIGGLDWPTLEIERLSIDSTGNIDIEGGWIDLPQSFALDFHAFKIDLDQIGIGAEETSSRQWIGLSGGIRLIEGVPLSAAVEGLRISWDPADPPTPGDPMRGVGVTLEGVAVHLEIPGTLVLDGSVRYRKIDRPPTSRPTPPEPAEGAVTVNPADASGVFGHVFTGSITLELTALNTQVGGELLIGELTSYRYDDESGSLEVGDTFTALYIVLAAELPSALPLGATGTGLYGIKGLFGIHVAPDRHLDPEGEPETWYAWYKAERGNNSARSVTKVAKWAPRFDNYAFGAGVTLGTVFDDGFSINAGLLAAILIPGPVVMIEGRANLLKPRGGEGGEGALYALIVFDGLAETFQMNVDINFTLEDVITVGGGLEAFFDFNNGEKWYIYVGRREPLDKRIRAEVIAIISASAYFMIDPRSIAFGAAAGLDLQAEYGPVEIKLILRISFDIELFFKEPQLTGRVELYGEISIRVCGIGIGLVLQALLEGSAPQPWFIHGLARVAVSLPFPLPSFDASVEFNWGQDGPPALVEVLKGLSMVHGRVTGSAWALNDLTDEASAPIAEKDWRVVPVDAIPVLTLGKPLSDVSLVEGASGWFRAEVTEGRERRYELRNLLLEERTTRETVHRWSLVDPRSRDLRLRPDPHAREPQVELWWYSPLDSFDRTSSRNYVDACPGPASPQRHCVDWKGEEIGTSYTSFFRRGAVTMSLGINQTAQVRAVVAQVPGGADRGLAAERLVLRFPEPVAWIEIRWADWDARFDLFLKGDIVKKAPQASGVRSYQPLSGTAGQSADTLHILQAPGQVQQRSPTIESICWITEREILDAVRRGDAVDRTEMMSELKLEPHKTYTLSATGVVLERAAGGGSEFVEVSSKTKSWGFRTGGLPGTDYDNLPEGVTTPRPDFAEGPLNEVSTYVLRTVPAAGTSRFYRGYDVMVELQDPYAAAMLAPVVDMQVMDRNGYRLASSSVKILTGPFPFITAGLLTLLTAPREKACAGSPLPWTRRYINRYLSCRLPDAAQPGRMVRVELTARPSLGKGVVFGVEFSTSRFRDIADHLGSGLVQAHIEADGSLRGKLRVRTLGAGPTPEMAWVAGLNSRLARKEALRSALAAALTVGEHDAGMTIVNARSELSELSADLTELYRGLFETLDRGGEFTVSATPTTALPEVAASPATTVRSGGIHDLFVSQGLSHRPLPTRVVEAIAVDTPEGWYMMLESPEPLDRDRITVELADTGEILPLLWSIDTTRALIFGARPDGLFESGPLSLRWTFLRGGLRAPDLDPLYREGELSDAECVVWDLFRS